VIEKVVARGGLEIPPDRMFEMRASEKLKSLNAYVMASRQPCWAF